MVDLILSAIPAFILLLVVEALSFHLARHDDHGEVGYEARDTRTSLTMGIGNVIINLGWKGVVLGDLRGALRDHPAATRRRRLVDLGAAVLRRRLLLLLVPPRRPPRAHPLGQPRRPPQLRALQPLDRAAPDLDADGRDRLLGLDAAGRLRPVDDLPGDELEPALPVLDPHRADRQAPAADRVPLQHAQPPPRPPRLAGAVPGQELRRDPDHLGPHARDLRARGRARALRPDDEPARRSTRCASPSTSTARSCATCAARARCARGSASCSGRPAGPAGRPSASRSAAGASSRHASRPPSTPAARRALRLHSAARGRRRARTARPPRRRAARRCTPGRLRPARRRASSRPSPPAARRAARHAARAAPPR